MIYTAASYGSERSEPPTWYIPSATVTYSPMIPSPKDRRYRYIVCAYYPVWITNTCLNHPRVFEPGAYPKVSCKGNVVNDMSISYVKCTQKSVSRLQSAVKEDLQGKDGARVGLAYHIDISMYLYHGYACLSQAKARFHRVSGIKRRVDGLCLVTNPRPEISNRYHCKAFITGYIDDNFMSACFYRIFQYPAERDAYVFGVTEGMDVFRCVYPDRDRRSKSRYGLANELAHIHLAAGGLHPH